MCPRSTETRHSSPEQTLFEPTRGRKRPGKSLLELLIEHYDELDRLLAVRDGDDVVLGQESSTTESPLAR